MELRSTILAIGTLLIIHEVQSLRHVGPKINPNCECGLSGEGISNRIVGGFISMPHIFPWIAAIFNKGELHCGGTLINDKYILTAGHCVKWTKHEGLTVGLGMHDIKNTKEGFISPIEEVKLHPAFESDYIHDTHDIALIKLKNQVPFSEDIRPVCLPKKGSDYTDENVKITGWGRVIQGGRTSRYLRQASLKVMSWPACRNTSFGEHLTESMICAYNANTDACQGDSGGPLLYKRPSGKYETIGIVSWGMGCAEKGVPGVYVRNTDYLNWINSNTKDAEYCLDS